MFTPKVIGVAIARYDFSSRDTRELSLQEGDVVKIYTKSGANGWWRGEVNGRVSDARARASQTQRPIPTGRRGKKKKKRRKIRQACNTFCSVIAFYSFGKYDFWRNPSVLNIFTKSGNIHNTFLPSCLSSGWLIMSTRSFVDPEKNFSLKHQRNEDKLKISSLFWFQFV